MSFAIRSQTTSSFIHVSDTNPHYVATKWSFVEHRRLTEACFAASTAQAKGKSLEDLVSFFFSSLPGLTLIGRDVRMGSQELDLVFWNDQVFEYFRSASAEIIVECKNWDVPVGSAEVAWFLEKMRQRNVSHGFFVTRSGVTGAFRDGRDGALDALYLTLRDGLRPVVLTLDELLTVSDVAGFARLFKSKIGRLFIRQL